MKALITGASSGIGREFARQLSKMGYDVIAVARNIDKLHDLSNELTTEVTPIKADLSQRDECIALFEKVKNNDIDILINNAGFGKLGYFTDIPLDSELDMISVNCSALHILTKLFLQKFESENKGYILNVCSVGGYMPGPLLSTYYATKAYVKSLTLAIREEAKRKGSNVYIGILCPGPVDTNFAGNAGLKHTLKSRSPESVVKYSIRNMFRKKAIIVPGFEVKLSSFSTKLLPDTLMAKISYTVQKKKM